MYIKHETIPGLFKWIPDPPEIVLIHSNKVWVLESVDGNWPEHEPPYTETIDFLCRYYGQEKFFNRFYANYPDLRW